MTQRGLPVVCLQNEHNRLCSGFHDRALKMMDEISMFESNLITLAQDLLDGKVHTRKTPDCFLYFVDRKNGNFSPYFKEKQKELEERGYLQMNSGSIEFRVFKDGSSTLKTRNPRTNDDRIYTFNLKR